MSESPPEPVQTAPDELAAAGMAPVADPEPEPRKVALALAFEINGWEQLKIAQLFRMTLQQFQEDLVMACRVALFVDGLRNGVSEGEAFQKAMVCKVAEVLDRVDITNAADEGGAPLDLRTPTT